MNVQLLKTFLESQSAALTTTRNIQTVLADLVNIIYDDNHGNEEEQSVHGGSRPGRCANLNRGFEEGYQRFYKDYLAPEPIYSQHIKTILGGKQMDWDVAVFIRFRRLPQLYEC
ncbi:hypothetical protein PGTUg99_024850 [Puccinia graminis f. sp. tritici]|uniref:Uncharacterized protein n=1 Tax=Puccinia graminis f. sp. tritici TaxID=56615 RepID=A0A5B0SIH7_PUCGR|nr:hypothetical protein PGTUg99_024850 [Puccinia graminis f. sp. tritici]